MSSDGYLATALGRERAEVLRLLAEPLTMGGLAARTFRSPSSVTALVDALAAADLVRRQRLGRFVVVRRTRRGDSLCRLMAAR